MLVVATACLTWVAPTRSPAGAPAVVRMEAAAVASWYDTGLRLVPVEALTEDAKGIVTPTAQTAGVSSWYDAGMRLEVAADETSELAAVDLLKRYLQLRNVLPGAEALPDATVEALIRRVEEETDSVFDEGTISGDWQLVWQKNAKEATVRAAIRTWLRVVATHGPRSTSRLGQNSQKALAPLPQYSNFLTEEKLFRNIVQVTKRRVQVIVDVAYTLPEGESPSRLGSTIAAASVEVAVGRRFGWKPLRVPLPLKGEGWLDVTFLSPEMRVTRGNRGGLFVHLRPSLLTREAAEQA